MIKINVYRTNNLITGFEMSCHADSGPYGYDLVCAGVSAVSFGSINAVTSICDLDLSIDMEDSRYLKVKIPEKVSIEENERIQLIFEAMIVSLLIIENNYIEFIIIKDK